MIFATAQPFDIPFVWLPCLHGLPMGASFGTPPRIRRLKSSRSDRQDTRALVVHVDQEIYRHFKILVASKLSTTDEMMHDALALLFERHNELEPLRRKLAQREDP